MKRYVLIILLGITPGLLFAQQKPATTNKQTTTTAPKSTTVAKTTTASKTANANKTATTSTTAKPAAAKSAATTPKATTTQKAVTTTVPASQPAITETPSAGSQAPATNTQSQAVAPATTNQAPVRRTNATTTAARSSATISSKPAPTERSGGFSIGIRGGTSMGTVSGLDLSDAGAGVAQEYALGFHGGLVMNIGGRTFSVQPEILYNQYGSRITGAGDYLQVTSNVVEVPILLKLAFGGRNVRVFINGGPFGNYLMNGQVKTSIGGNTTSETITPDSNDDRFSYGVAGGAGLSFKIGPGNLLLEGRFNHVLGTLGSDNTVDTKTNPQVIMGSVGYIIPLGGR